MTPPRTTLAQALQRAQGMGIERWDAQQVLAQSVGRPRSWLMAHADSELDADQWHAAELAWRRLAQGEPLAYVLGEQEFHGLALHVDPRVLAPRGDTEILVDWALELLAHDAGMPERARVVDLGTGSGAIALAVKHRHPIAQVWATDASGDALEVARANAQRLGLPVTFAHGSWWGALGDAPWDLVLTNPPYIALGDPHLPALRDEPSLALTSGADGLDALREIVAGAPAHLRTGGWLLLEHGHEQAPAVQSLLKCNGFTEVSTRADRGGRDRCTGARR